MTIQQQIETAERFAALWRLLMPELPAPDREQFLVWAGVYEEALVSRGINRAGAKVRKLRASATPMTSNDAERYANSVMRNEAMGIRRHEVKEHSAPARP
jgi:hypothetical protein